MLIAYFCAEFALTSKLPTYAGGLGVLAGDIIRESIESSNPIIGVGLYYNEGNLVCIKKTGEKTIQECEWQPADTSGLTPVTTITGERIYIPVPIQDRIVYAQAWCWKRRETSVYFLDTHVPQNSPTDRAITNQIYPTDKETRIKQELVLGIGGIRLLRTLNIKPDIYHSNDGHSAFLAFELIKEALSAGAPSFSVAVTSIKQKIVFTNHTLVAAGNEVFSNDLVSTMLMKFSAEAQIPTSEWVNLGLVQDSSIFSMTMLSLRMATKVGTVSAIHHRKAEEIWTDHPMTQVTNGINESFWDKLQTNDDATIWKNHQQNKANLIALVNQWSTVPWQNLEHTLIVGWARRIVQYKRPLAILQDLQSFIAMARESGKQIRVVFSGQPHPGDNEGIGMFEELSNLANEKIPDLVSFLPNYSLETAQTLVAGCDVWLNTPVIGFEACGTSGMKAALNGVLPLSTKDGWIDEVDLTNIGWLLDSNDVNKSIATTLKENVIPCYYESVLDRNGSEWLSRMKRSREMIQINFTTKRVLKEYYEKLYNPLVS